MSEEKLNLLRRPFPSDQVSKLPKPTKAQTDEVKGDFKKGIRCKICGGWHHKDVVHLDYVGHAALTNRLLDVDPLWSWEPVAYNQDGLPAVDKVGGLWIRLTVCGVTRLGYGHPDGKSGGDAIKEAIGDALRNSAMRFGCALDLWHKGDMPLYEDGKQNLDEQDEPERDDYSILCESLSEEIAEIKIGLSKGDYARAADSWLCLDEDQQKGIWRAPSNGGCFTTEERAKLKGPEFSAAIRSIKTKV